MPAVFAVEIEPQPKPITEAPMPAAEKKRCGYCHRTDGTHSKGCRYRGEGKPSGAPNSKANATCKACGERGHTRRSRECPMRAAHKKRKPLSRNDPKAKPAKADQAAAVATHRSAEALEIARERIEVDLADARSRQVAIVAEVTVLERLAAGLGVAR